VRNAALVASPSLRPVARALQFWAQDVASNVLPQVGLRARMRRRQMQLVTPSRTLRLAA